MKIEILNLKAQMSIAAIKEDVTMDNLHESIHEISNLTYQCLLDNKIEMIGPPYLKYITKDDKFTIFDIEWGFPVLTKIECPNTFVSSTYEGRALVTTYQGSYNNLDQAYTKAMQYIEDNNIQIGNIYYDYYLNDPDTTPEDQLLTQVVIPIKETV